LRILHVVPTYYPAIRYGGPIRSVHGLSAALVRRGHEVSVYTTSVDGESDLDVPLGQPVDMDRVSVRYFRVPALRRLYWCPELSRHLGRSVADFDVVHLHSIYLYPTYAAARAARKANVPYVVSPRGMLSRELIRRKSRWAKTAWLKLIEERTLAQANALHVTADSEAGEVKAMRMNIPELHCIPNGVEWPRPHEPLSAGPYRDIPKPYALFLSRISWKKGLDRLLQAWRQVPDLTLVIAGNDDEGYQASLEKMARNTGIADRVHFVGPVSDDHKWALYENAEMFVLPSYNENFGNVVAEAMAMACPVIVSPDVGIAELVRNTGAGIVSRCEPAMLAEAVRSLQAQSARRKEMGACGYRAAVEHLSWDAIAGDMEELYLSLQSIGSSAKS
jgi:glycosyltransferase involved in cell wall biosynthesis